MGAGAMGAGAMGVGPRPHPCLRPCPCPCPCPWPPALPLLVPPLGLESPTRGLLRTPLYLLWVLDRRGLKGEDKVPAPAPAPAAASAAPAPASCAAPAPAASDAFSWMAAERLAS